MNHDPRTDSGAPVDGLPPSEAWLFAQAICGKPISRIVSPEKKARAARDELIRLAQFSTRHAQELRELQATEAEARRNRELLEWSAQISTKAKEKLRALRRQEVIERDAWHRAEQFAERLLEDTLDPHWGEHEPSRLSAIVEWNPNQPRDKDGRWTATGGGGDTSGGKSGASSRAAGSVERSLADASDPSRWYLPAEHKGTWAGEKGKSTFRLKSPIDVNGKLVHEIQYVNGIPVLDKFALPGKTATVVLTGDRTADVRNAEIAWRKLNPSKEFPKNATFHHDLLHVVAETVEIDGKKTKVLIGKMQLIPSAANQIVAHQGSASVANHFYNGLGIDTAGIKKLAKDEALLAAKGDKFVAKAAKKIIPGRIAKEISRFVGRNVIRAIPIIGTGLAIVEFADNVEAHGIGGAIVRATPVLGDLVSAYDLGSDLAKQITDEANAAVNNQIAALNAPVTEAWQKASEQTIDAYQEIAPQIKVTNQYGPDGLVDPDEIATALKIYRGRMQQANLSKSENAPGFDFDAAAAEAEQDLKERLTQAAQKDAPPAAEPLH